MSEGECMVCGTEMVLVVTHEETHDAYRLHCPKRHAHGDIARIPRQWRGPFAVGHMAMLNEMGKGCWSHRLNRVVPWPV